MGGFLKNSIDFSGFVGALESEETWEYETGCQQDLPDVAQKVFAALQEPDDFPSLEAAILAGDRVALAVDANVPQLTEVLVGTVKALGQTGAGEIDVVLSDEATDETVQAVSDELGESVRVCLHRPSHREALRYLGADERADPIYLNRFLVDADFVIPISVRRPPSPDCPSDQSSVFPALADSRSRMRHFDRIDMGVAESTPKHLEPAWLLGVQMMLSVVPSVSGGVGQLLAGTPESIEKRLGSAESDELPTPASLVIAALDGDQQQQTWSNAARAIAAASRYAAPEATIVLWSDISTQPTGALQGLDEVRLETPPEAAMDDEEEFPIWSEEVWAGRMIARIAAEHRVLIHSRIPSEGIESMGLGALETKAELTRLSQSFASTGVVRAAQFGYRSLVSRDA